MPATPKGKILAVELSCSGREMVQKERCVQTTLCTERLVPATWGWGLPGGGGMVPRPLSEEKKGAHQDGTVKTADLKITGERGR